MIRVGFSGTRETMNRYQQHRLANVIGELGLSGHQIEWHHGDCIGADAISHRLAMAAGFTVVVHPPTVGKYRAFTAEASKEIRVLKPLPYLERNKAIVQATGLLVAAPPTDRNPGRGGTWFTVDYAQGLGRPVVLITPNGDGS